MEAAKRAAPVWSAVSAAPAPSIAHASVGWVVWAGEGGQFPPETCLRLDDAFPRRVRRDSAAGAAPIPNRIASGCTRRRLAVPWRCDSLWPSSRRREAQGCPRSEHPYLLLRAFTHWNDRNGGAKSHAAEMVRIAPPGHDGSGRLKVRTCRNEALGSRLRTTVFPGALVEETAVLSSRRRGSRDDSEANIPISCSEPLLLERPVTKPRESRAAVMVRLARPGHDGSSRLTVWSCLSEALSSCRRTTVFPGSLAEETAVLSSRRRGSWDGSNANIPLSCSEPSPPGRMREVPRHG